MNTQANSEAARLYEENKREYHRRVVQIVESSWEESALDDVPAGEVKPDDATSTTATTTTTTTTPAANQMDVVNQ